jgi:hypothetical protein
MDRGSHSRDRKVLRFENAAWHLPLQPGFDIMFADADDVKMLVASASATSIICLKNTGRSALAVASALQAALASTSSRSCQQAGRGRGVLHRNVRS